jgi:Cu/Ag efflux protein CusF
MGAMTMPYPVVDDQTLDRVKPGYEITADVVATNSDVHLDNIVVVKKSDAQK